ncbi:glutathione S-transferase 2-like isoform X2 [Miscanthus floridulus]|uniref:glutathione S-transferase 2-like isoform X2 n=1 Tax=Miscanthus floridulus TaxID=154761 RepID=UPI00345775FE
MASDDSSNVPLQELTGAAAATAAVVPPVKSPKLKLYSFWRSSCSQRVRIALNLKGLEYEYKPVNLLANEQSDPEFERLNPIKYVPALVDGETIVADSFAILLYLEDKYPQYPLLPQDPKKRALNIQIASIVGSSIQPLQNYPVWNFIEEKLDSNEAIKWTQHHINRGFTALEKLLKGCSTKYATGNEIQLSVYPVLARLHEAYLEHPVFLAALPEKQPDAPSL